jgi:hydroxyethylthiazole kinase-like uncharacterized protein yjeF
MLIDPLSLTSPPLFGAAHIRAIDHAWAAAHPAAPLMARAGAATAALAATLLRDAGEPVLILAGPGNNGGDALAAALQLRLQGFTVTVASRADPVYLPAEAAQAWSTWQADGGVICTDIPPGRRFGLVVDGLFGVGLQRAVDGDMARWVAAINAMDCPILALDVPSGLDADTGTIRGCAVRADHTLTFLGLKPGLLTADGPDHAGTLHLDMLGAEAMLPSVPGIALTQLENRHCLRPRSRNSHKGLFGHVGVIGGAPGMVGACLVTGRAALAQGAGSVTVAALDERLIVDYGEPCLMMAAPEQLVAAFPDVLVIGPGLGQTTRAHALLDDALGCPGTLLLDADALNLLAADPDLAQRAAGRAAPTLLTPHPGEAARLLGVSGTDIQENRIDAALRLAARFRARVALKGGGTIVARPDGHYAINTSGGPWLAQAGSGDRLAGMAAALLAQGLAAREALEAAVWLHGQPKRQIQQTRFLR